ncbi:zinc finger protein 346 [Morus notabilis]|uniref:zinc finger protein 346 n=1 Tax=Morus notabilis TaxID=981085 RepID=UPI000CECF3EB|nr:zinc finger protein 346 [Morus notabilis]
MADKWDGDTMPVEHAIQRELAYRRKLALQLKPDDDFLKDLFPLQVQSSTSSPISEPPSSSDISSESKRKEPPNTTILQTLPIVKNQESFHGNPMPERTPNDHRLHCGLCNVVCSSGFNLEQHVNGQKNRAKLQELREHPSSSTILSGTKRKEPDSISQTLPLIPIPFHGNPGVEGTSADHRLHCKLCNVVCSSGFNHVQHVNGQKHRAKLQELREHPSSSTILSGTKRKEPGSISQTLPLIPIPFHGNPGVEGTSADHRLHCELCNVMCSSGFNFEQHMNGQKHQAKLQELANGRRRWWCEVCKIPCMNEDLLKMHLEGRKHKARLLELNLSAAKGGAELVLQILSHLVH